MFLMIHVSSSIDLTGLATLVLALSTAALAWWTHRAVAQGAIEVERAHRPVLVPVGGSRPDPTVSVGPPHWPAVTGGPDRVLAVALRNVGMGPALNVRVVAEFGDQDAHPSSHGIALKPAVGSAAAIGTSTTPDGIVVLCSPVDVSGLTGFTLAIDYRDVAGAQWRTSARYSDRQHSYLDIDVRLISDPPTTGKGRLHERSVLSQRHRAS